MTRDGLQIIVSLTWILALGMSWLYARHGFSSSPRFDMWLYAILIVLNILTIGAAIERLTS